MITCLFVTFLVLLLMGVPISAVLVLSAALAIVGYSSYSLDIIAQRLVSQAESFPLLAIPFFVLAGAIMGKGGMSRRLIHLAAALVGNVRGGLAMASVVACMFFASISGSTAATTAAIGMVLMPAMIKSGYSRGAATGLQACAGSIGIVIPPSIPFILMGVLGEMSIGALFMGGILPGVAIGCSLMFAAHLVARIQGHRPSGDPVRLANVRKALRESLLSLLTVVFIIGSIMLGIATPTEAAIIAVVWALIVCLGIYRELSLRELPPLLVQTVNITGIVVFCIAATSPFAWLLTIERIPAQIAEAMVAATSNPTLLVLMMLVVLLVVGTFLDLTPALIILVPILGPIAHQIHMADVQFGVMMVVALAIGQCTPPVGIALFVACSVSKARIGEVVMPMLPFLLAMGIALLVVAFWPPLSTWLPSITIR